MESLQAHKILHFNVTFFTYNFFGILISSNITFNICILSVFFLSPALVDAFASYVQC